jgi:integrase/recombinase XerD
LRSPTSTTNGRPCWSGSARARRTGSFRSASGPWPGCGGICPTCGPKLAGGDDDGTLFLTAGGEPFGLERLTQIAARYVKASGVPKTGACHLWRHTMATLMLEGGADIRYIQAMLGHAELSTTQIYAQVSLRALQAVHSATHPAAGNTPRTAHHDGDRRDDRKVAVSELLAAPDEEDQEENRPHAGSPGDSR